MTKNTLLINQEILKASKNNHNGWKPLQLTSSGWLRFAVGVLQFVLLTVLRLK